MKKVKPKSEEQKLVDFFNSREGIDYGREGDYYERTPAETAIFYLKEYRQVIMIAKVLNKRISI